MQLTLQVNEQVLTVPVLSVRICKGQIVYRVVTSRGTVLLASDSPFIQSKCLKS
jgi:hypothetical protein